jgi:hypothetical protein
MSTAKSYNRLIEPETQPALAEVNLWVAVLECAVHDVVGSKVWQPSDDDRREAIEWFLSSSITEGSFYWVCDALKLSQCAVRAALFGSRSRL